MKSMYVGRKKRTEIVLDALTKIIPRPETELSFSDEYELIVAVILSAQCTDVRVNLVTPELFRSWPTFKDLAEATPEDVAHIISSISYPNNKARHLVGMATRVMSKYNGKLPQDQKGLMTLPGVGRKTAQVVSSVAFGDPDALPVDTHVFRVANRIGLVSEADTPMKVERGLKQVAPRNDWGRLHHLLILHGRYTCTARTPKCAKCVLTDVCKYYEAVQRLPAPIQGLDPKKGVYYCATRRYYFDQPSTRVDRTGTVQVACPKCNSMNIYASKTGFTVKTVPDYRIDSPSRRAGKYAK